jgi:hypothetical protein
MAEYGTRLATLDPETGEAPSSRIGNAGNARQLVNRLKYEDEQRMYRYTLIQGLMDGNPPWSSKKLQDLGQGHRANFNLRESEGIVEAAKTPYYDLVFEVPQFAQVVFALDQVNPTLNKNWSDIFSEEYSELLSGWDGFDHEMQLHQWQMVVNGVGPLFWPHYISWHSEATKARKVLVPQETKANVDKLELCIVLHSYRADELDDFISRGGTNEPDGEGWNIPLCKQAIIDCAQREMRTTFGFENYDLYQRAIRTGDIFYGIHRSDRIYVASIFVKEFGGKVSHYIISDIPLGNKMEVYSDPEKETGYLFKRRKKFSSFNEVICPFFFDCGPDGTWHSVKGLGPKIYDFCDVSNRTFCQMLDGAVIGSGVTLETQDANAIEETQIALVGGASVVSPGYKVVQTRIAEALQGGMVMRRELQNTLQSNTGSYRQRVEEDSQTPTLGQAQMNFQAQAVLGKGSNNRYYNHLDKWHRENVRRILDPAQSERIPGGREALEFVNRCVMRGIPEQILNFKNIRKVTATRSVGYGSPELRDMATRELVALIPYMDETGRNHALRARTASLPGVGMHYVDSFFPPIEKSGVPDSHAALAVLENNALRQPNGSVLVEPQQNHSTHFDVHMNDVMRHVQNPNASPQEKLLHMEQAGPHLNQHLNAISGDPTRKDEVRQKKQQLDQLGKISDQLGQQTQEQMKQDAANAPPPAGQPTPELMKVMGELDIKARKAQGDMAIKERKQAHAEQLSDAKTAAGIQRETARTVSQTRNEGTRARAAAGVEIQKARHEAGLSTATAAADNRRENIKALAEARRKDAIARAEARRKAQQPKSDQ